MYTASFLHAAPVTNTIRSVSADTATANTRTLQLPTLHFYAILFTAFV